MPSFFAFYRARGVPGAYVVGIQLDLLPTEEVEVSVMPYGGNCHWQEPIRTVQEETKRELYRIEKIGVNDTIIIDIHDRKLIPFQRTTHRATKDGFCRQHIAYKYLHAPRYGYDNYDYGTIVLNEITMIDLDKEDIVIQESSRIVDAAADKPQPKKRKRKPKVHHDNHIAIIPDIDNTPFTF